MLPIKQSGEVVDNGLSGMLHYKEISYEENIEDLKKFKKMTILKLKFLKSKMKRLNFLKGSR